MPPDLATNPTAYAQWLNTSPIPKIWEQMSRLYRNPVQYTDSRAAEERDRAVYDTVTGIMRDEIFRGHRRADQIYSTADHGSRIMDAPSDDDSSPTLSPA